MKPRKIYLLSMMLIGWFGIIAQLIVHMQASPAGFFEALTRFFSYFTILTNILVAVYVTALFFISKTNPTSFFTRTAVQTAITMYIFIVGLVYNIVLRPLYEFPPFQTVISDILHSLIPLMTLVYWWRWVNSKKLHLTSIPKWLIYPAAYAVYTLVRGYFADWYPYPFVDVNALGYLQVSINIVLLVATFLVLAVVFVLVGRRKGMSRARR